MKSQLDTITPLKKFAERKAQYSLPLDSVNLLIPLGMGYNSSINILYGSKKKDFIKFHLSVSQSKFGRQYIVRGMQEGLLTKTSFLWHQPEMTEALWLAVQTR